MKLCAHYHIAFISSSSQTNILKSNISIINSLNFLAEKVHQCFFYFYIFFANFVFYMIAYL